MRAYREFKLRRESTAKVVEAVKASNGIVRQVKNLPLPDHLGWEFGQMSISNTDRQGDRQCQKQEKVLSRNPVVKQFN